MSNPAATPEDDARDMLDNCGGSAEDALKHLQKIQEHILDQVHAVQGFDEYKRLKDEADNQ